MTCEYFESSSIRQFMKSMKSQSNFPQILKFYLNEWLKNHVCVALTYAHTQTHIPNRTKKKKMNTCVCDFKWWINPKLRVDLFPKVEVLCIFKMNFVLKQLQNEGNVILKQKSSSSISRMYCLKKFPYNLQLNFFFMCVVVLFLYVLFIYLFFMLN